MIRRRPKTVRLRASTANWPPRRRTSLSTMRRSDRERGLVLPRAPFSIVTSARGNDARRNRHGSVRVADTFANSSCDGHGRREDIAALADRTSRHPGLVRSLSTPQGAGRCSGAPVSAAASNLLGYGGPATATGPSNPSATRLRDSHQAWAPGIVHVTLHSLRVQQHRVVARVEPAGRRVGVSGRHADRGLYRRSYPVPTPLTAVISTSDWVECPDFRAVAYGAT
jgi:hypothetical protein